MKTLINSLRCVIEVFSLLKHGSASMRTTECGVEMVSAALRTCGSTGQQAETNHFMKYNPR